MFATKMCPENIDQIRTHVETGGSKFSDFMQRLATRESPQEYYFVTGWVGRKGVVLGWSFAPLWLLKKNFTFDINDAVAGKTVMLLRK